MNRAERRKDYSIKRKIGAMQPATRELAIQTGMELYDALAEKYKQDIQSMVDKDWASKRAALYKQVSEEQSRRFAKQIAEADSRARECQAELDRNRREYQAEADRKTREHRSEVTRWRRAYLAMYLAAFASGGLPNAQGCCLTATEAVEAAASDFKAHLTIIENRVQKEAGYFERPELLYGVLQWLATTYHGAKTGVSCPNFVESCRRASGFQYSAHQSNINHDGAVRF